MLRCYNGYMIVTDIVVPVLSIVAIFLFGIQKFSKQIHQTADERFKALLRSATATRLRGLLLGVSFTSLIQSSTATTVILASLVNAGLLSFENSIAVIFGANIGTTVTSQLIALNIPNIAPYIILIGFIVTYFGGGYKHFGKPIFYFGLIFFSLSLISLYLQPLKNDPQVLAAFGQISDVYTAIFIGVVFTAIIQSSSVTSGLVLVLVGNGLLTFDQAVGIIIGANLGTTATVLIASVAMNVGARRVALAHFLFNIIGIAIFLPFINTYSTFIQGLGGSVEQQVANAHIMFNVVLVVIFLTLFRPFSALVQAIAR